MLQAKKKAPLRGATKAETKSTSQRINGQILASGETFANACNNVKENHANELDGKSQSKKQNPNLVVETLNNQDLAFLKQFREGAKPILKYCIDNDPSAGPTYLYLSDEITDLVNKWKFEYREIEDAALRSIVIDTLDVLNKYKYYISEKFLRLMPNKKFLWFRNESWEEGEQLRNVLQPESYKLRCEMGDLYLRLYPLPEEDTKSENTTIVQQQTNIVQNGDNNINLTNNGTINIKL